MKKIKLEEVEVLEEREELFSEMIAKGFFSFEETRRIGGNFRHPLNEVLLVWICALICGFRTFEEMEWYGNLKINFLRKFFSYKRGGPSKSTLSRVIAIIDPSKMNDLLCAIVSMIKDETPNSDDKKPIALDGKTNCGAQVTEENKNKLHTVSAFDTERGITLAQETVPEGSNEIPSIKSLLSTLYIEGRTITIDAIGTQKENTKEIRKRGGDYILAVKENQKGLYHGIKAYFNNKENLDNIDYHEDWDKGHGRIERRSCYASGDVKWFDGEGWVDLKSFIKIEAERTINGKKSHAIRYYISSREPISSKLSSAIRSHWGIESAHWTLDVTFDEDNRIIWNRTIAKNETIARRIIMNMLKLFRDTFRLSWRKTTKVTYSLLQKILFTDDSIFESLLRTTFK